MEPALYGGTPIRDTFLPYAKQFIDESDLNAVSEVLQSDFLTTGPKAKEFEDDIASYVGAKYAVTFSNGTAALHGACYAAGISEGDEVITTPMTFASSANCVLFMGGKPVFADIDKDNFNIDINDIKKKITSKTKAIIPVDYTGQAVNIEGIKELVKGKDIVIIEDGAHSLGTKFKGKHVGSLADMTMFSFHPVKTITTGEGGIITTNNETFYHRLLSFRSHGIAREPDQLEDKSNGGWYYEQQYLGFNYRMTDFQAALGISQLKKIDAFIQRRKTIVNRYNEAFAEIDGLILQKNEAYSDTSNHLYILKLDLSKIKVDRKEIYNALMAENIGVNVHYIPVYWHPYYRDLGFKKGLCPVAEETYKSIVTIPLFPAMSDDDIDDVIAGVKKIIDYYRK
ncbi:UDP-4-amino-4,6-dideoxy-N-acetyl-beta-L-altrosamine transaminase [Jeotgalibaca sp. PTS2502]|uniref:UDP-4-amino-4, 6-dideoxy-N-acetyl-beta-L-altrosamine transaminase n=1 Tax=Jeotgalibaca sp. PTS2502 TaxID=1903686 RepID=UPI0009738861|nr:UDP-4-amino-4,6-dideoxy-N-acetyl-beta-L-altrosamine transaminase [Jeotgalibaca sp. PTS2502]APZ49662.1 UDP-4-amino-4,6-dideoxy-N-acetyl-beta-L-altrosamine transaminase [Jeotgalibaca sp. PTS2502]